MPNIEEQNLTEFLLEVKAKMANITTSENNEINDINEYFFAILIFIFLFYFVRLLLIEVLAFWFPEINSRPAC